MQGRRELKPLQDADGDRRDRHLRTRGLNRRPQRDAANHGRGAADARPHLARQARRPRRHRSRPRDRQPARRDHRGHLDRDLRLRPAPLRRRHPGRAGRATSSATSSWAAWSRPARTARSRRASGWWCPSPSPAASASSASKQQFSACDNSNPAEKQDVSETLYGHAMSGLFGYSHLTGGYPGGQAEYVRVPFSDVGPIVIPDEPRRRAGAVPVRHPADRLDGGGERRHRAGRHRRGLGLRPGRAVRHPERAPDGRRRRSSPSTTTRTGWSWPAGSAPRSSTSSRPRCSRR